MPQTIGPYNFRKTQEIIETGGFNQQKNRVTFWRTDGALITPEDAVERAYLVIAATEKAHGQVKSMVRVLNGRCWNTVKSMKENQIKIISVADYFHGRVREKDDEKFANFEKVEITFLRKADKTKSKKSKKSIKSDKSPKTPVKKSVKKKPQSVKKPTQKMFKNTRAQKKLRENED